MQGLDHRHCYVLRFDDRNLAVNVCGHRGGVERPGLRARQLNSEWIDDDQRLAGERLGRDQQIDHAEKQSDGETADDRGILPPEETRQRLQNLRGRASFASAQRRRLCRLQHDFCPYLMVDVYLALRGFPTRRRSCQERRVVSDLREIVTSGERPNHPTQVIAPAFESQFQLLRTKRLLDAACERANNGSCRALSLASQLAAAHLRSHDQTELRNEHASAKQVVAVYPGKTTLDGTRRL